mgnify:CR=1 FL=1
MKASGHSFVWRVGADAGHYRGCPDVSASGPCPQECRRYSTTEVRHRLFAVLYLAVAGVLAGCRSLTVMRECAAGPGLTQDAELPRV